MSRLLSPCLYWARGGIFWVSPLIPGIKLVGGGKKET